MTESEQKERFATRSIPRNAYVHVRCLDCGVIERHNSSSLIDAEAREFLATIFDHTAKTGHRVEVVSTECFYIRILQ